MSTTPYNDRYLQRSKNIPDTSIIPRTQWHWNYYCETEQSNVDEYAALMPTTCINGVDHVLNTENNPVATRDEAYVPNTFRIESETYLTNGHYRCKTLAVDVEAGATNSVQLTYPYAINIVRAAFIPRRAGDIVDVTIARDFTQGDLVTADYPVGTTSWLVSPEFLPYIGIGSRISITDGTTTDDLGEVSTVDATAMSFTSTKASGDDFKVSATLSVAKPYIDQYETISTDKKIVESPMCQYVPLGSYLNLTYTNNGTNSVHFVLELEFLF
jgi:hypothetical protein